MKSGVKVLLWVIGIVAVAAAVAVVLNEFVFKKKTVEIEITED